LAISDSCFSIFNPQFSIFNLLFLISAAFLISNASVKATGRHSIYGKVKINAIHLISMAIPLLRVGNLTNSD
jgi:hypothetical protein